MSAGLARTRALRSKGSGVIDAGIKSCGTSLKHVWHDRLELHGARAALADMHMSNQQLTDELDTLRRAHRPCSLLIDDLRNKVTSLQVLNPSPAAAPSQDPCHCHLSFRSISPALPIPCCMRRTCIQADLNRRQGPHSPREFQVASSLALPRRDTTPPLTSTPPARASYATPPPQRSPTAALALASPVASRSTTPPRRGEGVSQAGLRETAEHERALPLPLLAPIKQEPAFSPAHARASLTPRLHSVGIA